MVKKIAEVGRENTGWLKAAIIYWNCDTQLSKQGRGLADPYKISRPFAYLIFRSSSA
jgi:hypothetical protein